MISAMNSREAVRAQAAQLKLLDAEGQLKPLDSLNIMDLVAALEDELDVSIPSSAIEKENFTSIDSIAKIFDQAG